MNEVPSAPFRRDNVVFACINSADFDDLDDVALLRAALRLPHADTLNDTHALVNTKAKRVVSILRSK